MLSLFKTRLKSLLLSSVSPQEVSESFALGVFISLTPTIGFHTWLALGLAAVLKKNKIAALIGAHVTNPLTILPIFYFNFRLGEYLLRSKEPTHFSKAILLHPFSIGDKVLIPLWTGSLIVALVGGIFSYYLCLFLYRRFATKLAEYRKKHHEQHAHHS